MALAPDRKAAPRGAWIALFRPQGWRFDPIAGGPWTTGHRPGEQGAGEQGAGEQGAGSRGAGSREQGEPAPVLAGTGGGRFYPGLLRLRTVSRGTFARRRDSCRKVGQEKFDNMGRRFAGSAHSCDQRIVHIK